MGGNRASFDLGMSQNELALLIGASRQKVNAALALLEEGGAVKRTGNRVGCNVARLQRLAASSLSSLLYRALEAMGPLFPPTEHWYCLSPT